MILSDSKEGIFQLKQALSESEPIVIPTETVYGLAAKIDDSEAIKKIFLYKKRPFFDPLIVHISNKKQVSTLSNFTSPILDKLVDEFWPGPLTLVLPKSSSVSDVITSGLDSVGVRMPNHPLALKLSPTTAQHVQSDFPQLKILDGGSCQVGIESSVLKLHLLSNKKIALSMLRKGIVTSTLISEKLRGLEDQYEWSTDMDTKHSPGHMQHHYMPKIPIVFFSKPVDINLFLNQIQNDFTLIPDTIEGVQIVKPKSSISKFEKLNFAVDPLLACRELYSVLKEKSKSDVQVLIFEKQSYMQGEVWDAFLERISKASSLRYEI
jgi:L-threonylcarbamoyladenylate synthase